MAELFEKKCIPCKGDIPAFDLREIEKYIKRVDGWKVLKDPKGFSLKREKRSSVCLVALGSGHPYATSRSPLCSG